jgi:hypothetical protein
MVAVSERSHHVEVSIVHNNDEMIIGTSDKYVMHLAVQSKSLSYTPSDTDYFMLQGACRCGGELGHTTASDLSTSA